MARAGLGGRKRALDVGGRRVGNGRDDIAAERVVDRDASAVAGGGLACDHHLSVQRVSSVGVGDTNRPSPELIEALHTFDRQGTFSIHMDPASAEDATAQHVRRTLRALELLAERPQTQADLARELAVHRRTARRLLARLVDEGYAEADRGGRHVAFHATARLAVLGRQVADGLDLLAIAQRHAAELDTALAGARFVALLDDGAIAIAHVEEPDGVDPRAGAAVVPRGGPLHATAAGKVFLSADTALVGEVLNQELLAYTAQTHVTRADLLLDLATARERGYAVEDGEHRAGLRAVASPIVDHVGRVVAVLGAVPLPDAPVEEAGAAVRDVARACSHDIGAVT